MKSYEAIVIGGGPAGMTAALYLLRSEVKVAVVEKMSHGGQMLMTEKVDNYPGFPDGVMGYELADLMAAHVAKWEIDSFDRYTDEVRGIEPAPEGGEHKVYVGEEVIAAKTIVVCTGSAYRRLGLPGEEKFAGRGVSYCALCDGNFFRDQVVAVVGGGNSALEEALYLSRLVKKLYLIHRRDDFRGAKCYEDRCVVDPKMEIMRSTVLKEIKGGDGGVTSIVTESVKTGEPREISVEGVFIFVGFDPQGAFLPEALETDSRGFVVTDCEMRTNLPGIFAAGDIRSKLCRQVATAVGDGATAANTALTYLENHE